MQSSLCISPTSIRDENVVSINNTCSFQGESLLKNKKKVYCWRISYWIDFKKAEREEKGLFVMNHTLLFSMDPCALLITAGCFNPAGNHESEVLVRGCCVRIVRPRTADGPTVKISFCSVSVNLPSFMRRRYKGSCPPRFVTKADH